MLRINEIQNPRSCLNRAHDDEMVFVLLARDVAAPAAIRAWVEARVRAGKNRVSDEQITEALACAKAMEDYQRGQNPARD